MLAIASFVAVGVVTLVILWPRLDLVLATRPRFVIERMLMATNLSLDDVYRQLTGAMEAAYDRNERYLRRLAAWMRVASILITIEVLWWVADLVTRA